MRGLILLAVLALAVVPAFGADLQEGICTRVIDGDTICVKLDGDPGETRVRLYGIDCPERGRPYYGEARDYATRLTLGKRVRLEPVNHDRYGRLVAWLWVGEVSVNRALLSAGMAWWYQKYARNHPELGRLEEEARAGCRGLWCMCSNGFHAIRVK